MIGKRKRIIVALLMPMALWMMTALSGLVSLAQEMASETEPGSDGTYAETCTVEFEISGAIGPASLDLMERAEAKAEREKCSSLLMVINTPGGSLQTTRLMVERILHSNLPFLCLVAPAGGHAGSAGAILLQACHFSGAFETTNIGAATPVSGTGEKITDDMRKKIVNDTRSWVEGLAELRGRDLKFAREIVEEARAVSAKEALQLKAIEWVGTDKKVFLAAAHGRMTKLRSGQEGRILTGEIRLLPHDVRYRVMDILTNPQIAYLMFMGSLALLYYELTHPGTIAPGVIGGVGLLISLISLHLLDVTWGGVLLIALGIGLMIAEAFVASFGILGIGGIIAFFIGSLFLFDPSVQGFQLPILKLILPTTVVVGILMLGIAYLALSTRKRQGQNEFAAFKDQTGCVTEVDGDGHSGLIEIQGEIWKFKSQDVLKLGDNVRVVRHRGLTLEVEKEK